MGKRIIVCSDGTGNAGGRFDGTNVWRIHQAIDRNAAKTQVVIYQDGVGTSTFRPLAILGKALSFGITKDLESLYEQVITQFEDGDELFLFGFSRGAFTIRTLSYMLYRCGIADTKPGGAPLSPIQVKELAAEAVRAYKLRHVGEDERFRTKFGLANAGGEQGRFPIKFIGVWDTVSAVGLPFVNVTQGLLTFWRAVTRVPLLRWAQFSLLNFHRPTNRFWWEWEDDDLHPEIENAYHALAIDDERHTFYPVLWRELEPVDNGGMICEGTRTHRFIKDRHEQSPPVRRKDVNVEQVWFAGMHSNVGGGYPKDHMAYVSLRWIMEHASRAGLLFEPIIQSEYVHEANELGKMYDSRSGLAIYYRYRPRDITWFCANVGLTGTYWTPRADGEDGPLQTAPADDVDVLLSRPLIHRSAFNRVEQSPRAYAPSVVPPPGKYMEADDPTCASQPQSVFRPWQEDAAAISNTPVRDELSVEQFWVCEKAGGPVATPGTERPDSLYEVTPHIVLRRATYYWIAGLTLLFFLLPAVLSGGFVRRADNGLFGLIEWAIGEWWFPIVPLVAGPALVGCVAMCVRTWLHSKALTKSTGQPPPRNPWVFVPAWTVVIAFAAFALRPAVEPVVTAVLPGAVAEIVGPVFGSPVLFTLLTSSLALVLLINSVHRDRILDWAGYGWNSTRFAGVPRPKVGAWIRLLRSQRGSRGHRSQKGLLSFFDRVVAPGVPILLLLAAIAWFVNLGLSDILIRMRVHEARAPAATEPVDTEPQPPAVLSKTVAIDTKQIVATGFNVVSGRLYRVKVSDVAEWKDWCKDSPTADGIPNPDPLQVAAGLLKRDPSQPYFKLCASVGVAGPVVPIGTGTTFVAPKSGELFLFVNDVPGAYWNNSGTATATIEAVQLE